LVPTIIASEVLRIIQDSGVVVSRARHIPMTSNDLRIPNEDSGVSVYWADELAATTQGEPTFGQNILTAKRLSGRAVASIEAIEDSVIGLIPYIQNVMAEKIGKELDQEALEGDGTNFTGLVAASGINSVATTASNGEAIAYIDLVKAVYAADESSVEDGCAWFMHRKVLATIVALVDTTGRPIFQPSVAGGVPNTILGFPVYTTSCINTARTRGSNNTTSNVYFGNPRRLIFGDRSGLRFDVTDTGPNWEYYAVDMRLNGRWGFTVGTPAAFSVIVGGLPISQL
jgi:HK97 family phage major capsid protein